MLGLYSLAFYQMLGLYSLAFYQMLGLYSLFLVKEVRVAKIESSPVWDTFCLAELIYNLFNRQLLSEKCPKPVTIQLLWTGVLQFVLKIHLLLFVILLLWNKITGGSSVILFRYTVVGADRRISLCSWLGE